MTLFNPGSLQKIAICIYNKNDFYTQNQSQIPLLYYNMNNNAPLPIPAASFDFYASPTIGNMETFASKPSNYYFGACESFKIDKIDYYAAVPTFTYSDYISLPKGNTLKTKGTITVPVVLPYNSSVSFSKFLECLWRISIYTFSPFFFYTTVNPINLGGPLFSNSFSISVSDTSPVKIDMGFEGGTVLSSNMDIPITPQTIDSIFPFPSEYNPLQNTFTYRQAKTYDCFFLIPVRPRKLESISGIYSNYSNQTGFYSSQNNVNIISMNLKIIQELEMSFTANDGISKNIINGPKHIGLKKRKVSGSVTFMSTTDLSLMYDGDKIQKFVMYFGGPFYYPMTNVNVQQFDVSITANEFKHTIDFIALLGESIFPEYYLQNEFDINLHHFSDPITGNVYTQHHEYFF
jgi:hypothetical protein